MNRIILLGRTVKDAEVRYTQTGKVVASFTLAVDRPFTSQDGKKEADFINCQLWGKSAETFGNTVSKGQRVLVEGRLQIRSYDAKDGSKRWITEVVCDRFEYVERRDTQTTQQSAPQAAQKQTAPMGGSMESFGSTVPFDEEIPF